MSAADRTADGCPSPGAEQAAAHRALARVVRVRATSQAQDKGRCHNAGSHKSLHHLFLFPKLGATTAQTKK
jgi:hypothetical protein